MGGGTLRSADTIRTIKAGTDDAVKPEATDIACTLLSRDYKGPGKRQKSTVVMYETDTNHGK